MTQCKVYLIFVSSQNQKTNVMKNAEKNLENLNTFFAAELAAENEKEDTYCDPQYFRVTEKGIIYKNSLVIQVNLQEGTVYSRQQFGSSIDDARFLRRMVREIPSILSKPVEVI